MGKTRTDASKPQAGSPIVDRMLQAYGVKSVTDLAAAMGRSPTTAKNWRSRASVPLEHLVQTTRQTGRSLDWLVLGGATQSESAEGAMRHTAMTLHVAERVKDGWPTAAHTQTRGDPPRTGGGSSDGVAPGVSHLGALLPVTDQERRPLVLSLNLGEAGAKIDYEVIPMLCGGANGPRSGELQPLTIDRAGEMAMTYDWLQRNLDHTTGQLASVRVIGDSMQPTLLDGDTIIVDRGVHELLVDAIYLLDMMGQRLVKRVQRKFDGSVVIISDNPAYERETIGRGQVADLRVLGRMVWPRVR